MQNTIESKNIFRQKTDVEEHITYKRKEVDLEIKKLYLLKGIKSQLNLTNI